MVDRERSGTATVTRSQTRARVPRPYRVVLHNDDYTTMDFVVRVLERHFSWSPAEAVALMLQVHHQGRCIAGVFPREVAESKVVEVSTEARRQGMPLLATAEPEVGEPEEDG